MLQKVLSETLMPHIKDLWQPCCQFLHRLETSSKSVDKTHKQVYRYDMTFMTLLLKSTIMLLLCLTVYSNSLSVFRILEATVAAFCRNKLDYSTIIARHCLKGDKHDCEQGQTSAHIILVTAGKMP